MVVYKTEKHRDIEFSCFVPEGCLFLRDFSVKKESYSKMENPKPNFPSTRRQRYKPIVATFFLQCFLVQRNKYRLSPFFGPLFGVPYATHMLKNISIPNSSLALISSEEIPPAPLVLFICNF